MKIILSIFMLLLVGITDVKGDTQVCGQASWYGGKFHGRKTASGEIFNKNNLTAAHKTLKFGTRVEVTNPKNGNKVIVKITDRGPFIKNRMIDLSEKSATILGIKDRGIGKVCLKIL